jgi:cytochrome c553
MKCQFSWPVATMRANHKGRQIVALVAIAATAMIVSAPTWSAGDASRGYARAQMCAGCHGIADYRTAFPDVYPVPRIGGQQEAYIVKALQDYKTGARKHPSMRAIAGTLNDQDMADLAAYYANARNNGDRHELNN